MTPKMRLILAALAATSLGATALASQAGAQEKGMQRVASASNMPGSKLPRSERRSFALIGLLGKPRDLDGDGDRQITQAEIDARAVLRFVEADTDKDGFLSKEEFVAMLPERGRGKIEDRRQMAERGLRCSPG